MAGDGRPGARRLRSEAATFEFCVTGAFPEAIRDLESIRGKRDTELAAICAIIHCHARSKSVDRDAVAALERELPTARERASPAALLLTSSFFWHINELVEARTYVDKVLAADPSSKPAQTLRGWVDLCSSGQPRGKDQFEKSIQWFDGVLADQESRCAVVCAR